MSNLSHCRATAKKVLNSEQGEEVDEGASAQLPQPDAHSLTTLFRQPPAEREYLLEYYALVRAGKTNYVATTAMLAFFGHRGQEPTEFFKTYSVRPRFLFVTFCERSAEVVRGWRAGGVQAEEAAHDEERGRGRRDKERPDARVRTRKGRGYSCEERRRGERRYVGWGRGHSVRKGRRAANEDRGARLVP